MNVVVGASAALFVFSVLFFVACAVFIAAVRRSQDSRMAGIERALMESPVQHQAAALLQLRMKGKLTHGEVLELWPWDDLPDPDPWLDFIFFVITDAPGAEEFATHFQWDVERLIAQQWRLEDEPMALAGAEAVA